MNPSSSYGDAFIDEYISWVEAQRSSASEPDFLYLTTWAGLANRLIALLSAFALALATKRVLVIDESALPEPLLAPPVAWDVDSWPQFARLRTAQQAAVGEGWLTTDTPGGWVTIDTERKPFDATLTLLGCANLSVAYPQRVLHLHSIAQYLVPLLQLNRNLATAHPRLGGSPVARLARLVLRPAAPFAQAARMHASAQQPRPLLGVQLRLHNVWVRPGTPRLRSSAAACARAMAAAHGAASAHLASDDLAARDALAASLRGPDAGAGGGGGGGAGAGAGGGGSADGGGGAGVLRDGLRHVSSLDLEQRELKAENRSHGWLELLLLAQSDALLTTGGSSYGYVARALSVAPLRRQRVLSRWAELERRGSRFALEEDCPTLRTREPCLMHAWRPDWNVSQLPCFDAARFTPAVLRHLTDPLHETSQCFR